MIKNNTFVFAFKNLKTQLNGLPVQKTLTPLIKMTEHKNVYIQILSNYN